MEDLGPFRKVVWGLSHSSIYINAPKMAKRNVPLIELQSQHTVAEYFMEDYI